MHPDWWTIVLQTINFAILVWVLHRFLYKPVLAMIDARKAKVSEQFEAARQTEEKAKAELAAVEHDRAGIAAEREEALKAAAMRAQEMAQTQRSQAERDAQALTATTRKSLAEERDKALQEAQHLALDLGAAFAQRLLAEIPVQYRAEAWIERIGQHLSDLPQAERDSLAHQLAGGRSLEVVTSSPLPPATATRWKERLHSALGTSADVAFKVNADLIAGAELHFPSAILSFSWQSALKAARSEVGVDARPR